MRWRAAALLAAAILAPSAARAEWREASSDHFVVYADANDKWLRGYAERLERFDAAMRLIRNVPNRPEDRSNRLTVYVLPGSDKARELCGGCGNVAGFYIPRAGGSVAFTIRSEGSGPFEITADTVLFHEYTHHFLLANFPLPYPRWFGEGFAEFHAASTVDDAGNIGIGRVPQNRAPGLRRGAKISIEQLLQPTAKPNDAAFWDVFYGRAWVLTHLLTFGEGRKGQLGKYLTLLTQGKDSLSAAREAFGDLKQLDGDINRAINKTFDYWKIDAARLKVGAVTTRALTPGEAAMMPVRLRSDRGVNHQSALALLPLARKRAAPFPKDAAVQTMLAEAEYDAGEDAAAEAAADRALAADPGNREAMMYKGRVLVRRLAQAKSRDTAAWKAARGWFIRANRADPNAAEPLMLNYTSYLAAGDRPSANAVLGLNRAFELSPHALDLRFMTAMQLLRDEKTQEARALLVPLTADAHSSGAGKAATAIIAKIDAGDAASAVAEAEAEGEKDGETQ